MKISKIKAREVILKANKILLLIAGRGTYVDGDALGSSLGLGNILSKVFDKKIELITDFYFIKKLSFLPGIKKCSKRNPFDVDFSDYDLVIICDASTPELVVKSLRGKRFAFGKDVHTLSIDHHATNTNWATYTLLDKNVSSASEILASIFKQELNKEAGVNFLVGILWDTGHFKHKTSPETIEIVGDILNTGVDLNEVSNRLNYPRESEGTLDLLKKGIDRIAWSKRNLYTFTFISYEDLAELDKSDDYGYGVSSLVNFYSRCLEKSKFGLTFVEESKGQINAELRGNKVDYIDLSKIAQKFGGGGHFHAAGFQMKGELRRVITRVTNLIDKYLKKNDVT